MIVFLFVALIVVETVTQGCDVKYFNLTPGSAGYEKSDAMRLCENKADCNEITCDGDSLCWIGTGYFSTSDYIKYGPPYLMECIDVEKPSPSGASGGCQWEVKSQGDIYSL